VRTPEEFYKAGNDAGPDDLLDGRIAFLGEKLPELGRRLELQLRVVREHVVDHLAQLLRELPTRQHRRASIVVHVRGRVAKRLQVPSLCQRLLALLFPDLHRGIFAPPAKLVRLQLPAIFVLRMGGKVGSAWEQGKGASDVFSEKGRDGRAGDFPPAAPSPD